MRLPRSGKAIILTCAVIFFDRFPLDDVTHTELRVKACSYESGPYVMVESRTYERYLTHAGYRYRVGGSADEYTEPAEGWWRLITGHLIPPPEAKQ